MNLLLGLVRLTGRLLIATADEIDRALATYTTEIPDVPPAWLDEGVDL